MNNKRQLITAIQEKELRARIMVGLALVHGFEIDEPKDKAQRARTRARTRTRTRAREKKNEEHP